MTGAIKNFQISVPLQEVAAAELLLSKMGWLILNQSQNETKPVLDDSKAMQFLQSLQFDTSTPVPVDENIFDAIVENKYFAENESISRY